MSPQDNQLAYRQAAIREADPIDLVIALYDILAKDLRDAITAMEAREVETRTAKLKHGLLALHQLQAATDQEAGEVARGLSTLYSTMRGKIMEAQIKQDPEILREQLNRVLQLRSAWAQVNQCQPPASPAGVPQALSHAGGAGADPEQAGNLSLKA